MQIAAGRLIEHIARVGLSGRVLQAQVGAEPVLRPDGVIERQRNARLIAGAVERADSADLSWRGLVRGAVRVQVVEDVQQRHRILVLRKIEQASVRAFHLSDPLIRTGIVGRGGARAGDGQARGPCRAQYSTEKASAMCLCFSVHDISICSGLQWLWTIGGMNPPQSSLPSRGDRSKAVDPFQAAGDSTLGGGILGPLPPRSAHATLISSGPPLQIAPRSIDRTRSGLLLVA